MGILTDEMKRVVDEQRLGFVATVCPDGTPNLSPKGTTAVLDDHRLVFIDFRSPQTVRNLRVNPSIEINVVDPVVRKGFRFKGTAKVLSEGFEDVVSSVERFEGLDRSRMRAIVVVEVTRAERLISPAYDWGNTEDDLRKIYKERLVELYGPF
jgi:hypothetical protein